MQKLWWFVKCFVGLGSIHDGSICWFSRRWFDVHDYPAVKGGDGYPCHFSTYTCPMCGVTFVI